jgi:hypothetical protein
MKKIALLLASLMLSAQPALAEQRKPLVLKNGQFQQVQPGDTLDVASLPTSPTITSVAPHAASNAILSSISSSFSRIVRDGFASAGDSASTLYTASSAPCSLNSGAGDGGSQVASSDGKCWIAAFGPQGPDVRQFGARGDGSTDDTAAVQNWVNYLSANGKVGTASQGSYKLTGTISAGAASYWGWKGAGKYKTGFFYAGSTRSSDIFAFGGSTPSQGTIFSDFTVFSFVPMTGGTTFKLTNFTGPVIDDVTFGGELYAKNTWHGVWFNGVHEGKLTRFDIMGQGDGIIVNAGSLGNSSNSDLYLDIGFSNNNGGAGIRQAGGFGGLNVNQVQVLGNGGGQLVIDNSISTDSNRETILSSNFVADGVLATQDNIVLNSPNSSSANLITAGTIGSGSRYGINVISWPNSYINISAGRIYNNGSDAIHMTDGSVTLVCGSGASIDTNSGIGIYSSVANANSYVTCPMFGNASGNLASTIGGWKTFATTLSSASGSYSSASGGLRYSVNGKTISFRAIVSISANGTASGSANLTLPFPANATASAYGRAASISGKMLQGFISGSSLLIYSYDGTYPGSNGENLVVSGTYEAQ